jgi:hypothetical protein
MCAFRSGAFGELRLGPEGYGFAGAGGAPSGSGRVTWAAEAFGLSGGPLPGFGIDSGLVYASTDPADPGMRVDLYNGLGTAVGCRAIHG